MVNSEVPLQRHINIMRTCVRLYEYVCILDSSSNINEVIKTGLNFLLFFTKIFYTPKKAQKSQKEHKAQKAQKEQKAPKSTKSIKI